MDKEAAINELMPTARRIAAFYLKKCRGCIEYEELLAVALYGAFLALDRYDESRQSVSVFAGRRMAGEIRDYLRRLNGSRRGGRGWAKYVEYTLDGMGQGKLLDGGPQCVDHLKVMWDHDSPSEREIIDAIDAHTQIGTYLRLANLTAKERYVIEHYYWFDETMLEISASLKVNQTRVSQLHNRAVMKMRQCTPMSEILLRLPVRARPPA